MASGPAADLSPHGNGAGEPVRVTLIRPAPVAATVHVFFDLYGVLLDSERMRLGHRSRVAQILQARFGGDLETWLRAEDQAYERYVQRVDEADWEAERWTEIEDRLDAQKVLEILRLAGVTWEPPEPVSFARELEFEGMSSVDARFPDAGPALERLRRNSHRLYVATGASDANARGALIGAKLLDSFDRLFTGTTQDAFKTQSRYWEDIPTAVGPTAGRCILIEDRLDYLVPAASVGSSGFSWIERAPRP